MAVKIKKIKDGKWKLTISHNNKVKRITVGSKRQAISLKDEIELNIARQKLGFLEKKEASVLFKEVATEWQLEHFDSIKPASKERYETILRLYIIPKFSKKDIQDIRRSDILKYLRGLHKKDKSVAVLDVIGSVLSMIFLYAFDMEYIENNPTTQLKRSLKFKRIKKEEEPFTTEEIENLFSVAPDELKIFFLFAFRTGCRLGEILGLHWDDLDMENGTVTIRRSCNRKVVGTPKNGKERTVDLSPQLVKELSQLRKVDAERCIKSGQKPMVVFNRSGDYVYNQYIRRIWIKMLEDAEIEYRKFHNIRHTVASLLIDAGLSPTAVQHQLGHHSSRFTLDVYAKRVKKNEAITSCLDRCSSQI